MYDFTGVTGAKVVIYDSSAAQSGKLSATADIVGAIANVTEGNAFTLFSGTLDASEVVVTGSGEGSFGAGINSLGKVYVHGGTVVGGQVEGPRVNHGGGAIAVSGANAALYMTNGVIEKGFTTCGGAVLVQGGATFTMDGGNISKGKATYDGGNVFVWGGTFNMNGGVIMDGVLGENARYGTNVAFSGATTFNMNGGIITGGSTTKSGALGGVYADAGTAVTLSGNAKICDNTVAGAASNLYLKGSILTIGKGGLDASAKIGFNVPDGSGKFTTGDNVTAAQKARFIHDGGKGIVFAGNGTPLYLEKYGYQVGYAESDYASICVGMGLSGYGDTETRICDGYDEYGLDIQAMVVTDDEGDTAVICSVEAVTINESYHTKLRKLVATTYGIPAENVMITSNHQHSTPIPGTGVNYKKTAREFNNAFQALFMDAVARAFNDRQVTTLYTCEPKTDGLNYVRNTMAYNKSTKNYLGMVTDNHTDLGVTGSYGKVQEWAGDKNMQLVWFDRAGKDIVLANFAVHPHAFINDSNYTLASSNFTGRFRKAVSDRFGGCHAMYITGAAGDMNMTGDTNNLYTDSTLTTKVTARQTSITAYVNKMMTYVPASLNASNASWKAASTGQVKVDYKKLNDLPANNAGFNLITAAKNINEAGSKEDRDKALTNYQNSLSSNEKAAKWIYSIYHADAIVNRYNYMYPNSTTVRTTKPLTVYAISIGGVSFGGVPYEMFSEDGRAVKNADLSHQATIICYLANGHQGYVPSARHWQNGGYSVDIAYFGSSASTTLNSTLGTMLNDLK